MFLSETLQEKWQPVLEHADLPEIKVVTEGLPTTVILEDKRKFKEDVPFLGEKFTY